MKLPADSTLIYSFNIDGREYTDNIKEVLVAVNGGNITGGWLDKDGKSGYVVTKKDTVITLVGEKSLYHIKE